MPFHRFRCPTTRMLIIILVLLHTVSMVSAETEEHPRLLLRSIENGIMQRPELFGENTRLLDLKVAHDRARLIFSAELADDLSPARAEELLRVLINEIHPIPHLQLFIDTPDGPKPLDHFIRLRHMPGILEQSRSEADVRSLGEESDYPVFPISGPLSGKSIVVSPGHGWYWVDSLDGWYTQRGETHGVIEDMSNWHMADHVIRALEHTGAYVFSCRERDVNTNELIVDDDDGAPVFDDGGLWTASTMGAYRYFSTVDPTQSPPLALWRPDFPQEDYYAVYVWYRAGENRVTDARYIVRHADGQNTILVNQEVNDRRWLYLGTYRFHEGNGLEEGLDLLPVSNESGVVVADKVKFGGGMGSIIRDNFPSGKPRFEEAARYWVEYVGAPPETYHSDWEDNSADVTTRPLYANWQGADAYLSIHSNAYNGAARGTETFMYNGVATAGSESWRNLVQERLIDAFRSEWYPDWIDRGVKTANFGEVRELESMPGCLTEIAFHDNADDAAYLKNPAFRETVARAIASAALEFFNTGAVMFPLPVEDLQTSETEAGSLLLSWSATEDPTYEDADPERYRISVAMAEGPVFRLDETTETSFEFSDLAAGDYIFRVTAINGGGESLESFPIVGEVSGAIDGDAAADGDRVDADVDGTESDGNDRVDGDQTEADGDEAEADGDDGSENPSIDGDFVIYPDGDEIVTPGSDGDVADECLPGYVREGMRCVLYGSDDGGCSQTTQRREGRFFLWFILISVAWNRRRIRRRLQNFRRG